MGSRLCACFPRTDLTIHSSRTRFVASRFHPASRAGRLNSGVRTQLEIAMSRVTALTLACVPFACFAGAGAPVYQATSHTSCGSYESGAYHISIDTQDDVVLIYANDLMGPSSWVLEPGSRNPRELIVMSCRVDIGQCTSSTKASLQLLDRPFGAVDGILTYERSRSGTTTIKFRTKPEHPVRGTVCG